MLKFTGQALWIRRSSAVEERVTLILSKTEIWERQVCTEELDLGEIGCQATRLINGRLARETAILATVESDDFAHVVGLRRDAECS
jgi:hypothetical protein